MSARRTTQTSASLSDAKIGQLRAELAARIAEAEWLKQHYDRYLREAYDEIAALRLGAAPAPAPRTKPPEVEGEVQRLRQEVQRMKLGEERYLDRIAELKERLSRQRGEGAQ